MNGQQPPPLATLGVSPLPPRGPESCGASAALPPHSLYSLGALTYPFSAGGGSSSSCACGAACAAHGQQAHMQVAGGYGPQFATLHHGVNGTARGVVSPYGAAGFDVNGQSVGGPGSFAFGVANGANGPPRYDLGAAHANGGGLSCQPLSAASSGSWAAPRSREPRVAAFPGAHGQGGRCSGTSRALPIPAEDHPVRRVSSRRSDRSRSASPLRTSSPPRTGPQRSSPPVCADPRAAGQADKGKGKGKTRPKTPEELNFERSKAEQGGRLWLRSARLRNGVEGANGIEVGTLDEGKPAMRAMPPLSPGVAHFEVLCNRQSILGNPFDMKKREELRSPVLEAYAEFLQLVLEGAQKVDIEGLALRHGLLRENCGKDWRSLYESMGGAAAVRQAFVELVVFSSMCRMQGQRLRLVCHCLPRACHATILAQCLEVPVATATAAAASEASAACAASGTHHTSSIADAA